MTQGNKVRQLLLVGATGLVGGEVIARGMGREGLQILALARREIDFPQGAQMEALLAPPEQWASAIARTRPDVFVCALGTTWRKSGQSEEAFRAVDNDLVLASARAAHEAGARHGIFVSAAGADAHSKNFYLGVKGKVDEELGRIGFDRLDILRPGLLRGARSADRRVKEKLAILASPLTDLALHGRFRAFRSISAATVAQAILALAQEKARGRFIHENEGIHRAARRLGD